MRRAVRTHTVENVPSYKSIHGMDLMTACREHVESLGVAIEEVNEVEEVRLTASPRKHAKPQKATASPPTW